LPDNRYNGNSYEPRLHLLLEVTKAINDNYSREQLVKIFESILNKHLRIPRYEVYSVQSKSRLYKELSFGLDNESVIKSEFDVERYLHQLENVHEILYVQDSFLDLFDALIPVYHKNQTLAYIIAGWDEDGTEQWQEDLKFVQALANIIYVAFENKKLAKQKLEQESLRKELELASHMQSMLLPTELPQTREITVDAIYKSHAEVGGDYYDFFRLNEDEYALCVADVSGKGVSAALLMSNFQANVRALFSYVPTLEELAHILNAKVMNSAKGEKFITAFLGKYNIKKRELKYINAGHNPPVIVRDNKLELLKEGCLGLGMLDELPFVKMKREPIPLNTLLVCYTDGLTELENKQENLFGLDSLMEIVRDNRECDIPDLLQQIITQLNTFRGEMPYKDDIALMACKFN
jgi:sigma-B regulation protein RsbU (phosphoserine phosphatase)